MSQASPSPSLISAAVPVAQPAPAGAPLTGPPTVLTPPAPTTPRPLSWQAVLRRVAKVLLCCLVGYGVLWAGATGGMLALSVWARHSAPDGRHTAAGINHFLKVDDKVYRGSAPTEAGYRELAADGVRTVVDLRAEHLSARELALPAKAGLTSVRLPIRDGQTPTDRQVDDFLRTVRASRGPVFVHCGAGVGRTGAMTAAYLVRTGQDDALHAAVRTVAVGPPSIEQVYYVLHTGRHDSGHPPTLVSGISRLLDAPRRIKASL